jgi:ubiquinone/menaquinone biosynthesis C-methylase UbiE
MMTRTEDWLRKDWLKVLPEDIFDAYERFLVASVFEPWGRRLIEAANIQPGENVLDLACGTGIVGRLAAPGVGETGTVTGLDLLPGMLNVARREARGLRPQIIWIEGDATKMPLPDAGFDVVLCQQGLQFFPDKVSALTEVRRVLKPGGRLVLTAWRSIDRSPGVAALQHALERHAPDAAPMLPLGFSLSDAEELRTYLSKAGFSDAKITIVVGSARFTGVDDFLRRYLGGLPIAGLIAGLPAERRAAIAADVSDALRDHVDDEGIVFPTEINQVLARA